jgi:hypothetical protein
MDNNTGGRYGSDRGGWSVTVSYKLGWTDTGDWGNYTRDIPTGTYEVVAGMSHGSAGATDIRGTLDLVTSDPTQPNQTLQSLGKFVSQGTGSWGRNKFVWMTDAADMVKAVDLGGEQTLRFTMDSGDFDYFWLVPSALIPQPGGCRIAYVSFHGADDMPSAAAAAAGFTEAPDVGFTQLLEANGHAVDRILTTGTPDPALLAKYDVIILSRSVPSSNYQDANATRWNAIDRPIIVLNGYLLRNSRMGYTTGGTMVDTAEPIGLLVNDPAHPVFAGIALDAGNVMVNPYAGIVTFNSIVQRGISVNTDPVAGGGTVLATVATATDPTVGGMVVGEWQAGATMGNGTADTLAGHRLVILGGSREMDITSEAAGIYDLEADGAQMLLNAVAYMCDPVVAIDDPMMVDGNVTFTWRGDGEVETAPEASGPWTGTGNTSGSFSEPVGPGQKYYRIAQ